MGRRASREISPCNYVFVYGTLRKNYLRLPASVRKLQPPHVLLSAGTWFGEGRLSGYDLWDLGDYPGIVKSAVDERSVCGDIVRIDANAQMMQTLDAYEGISSEYIRPHEYQREIVNVDMSSDGAEKRTIECWVYVYNWPITEYGVALIENGDYVSYAAKTI